MTEKCNASKPVYCPELDRVFPSTNNCAKELGLSTPNLRKVLSGKRKTCSGYHFEYHVEDTKEVNANGDQNDRISKSDI